MRGRSFLLRCPYPRRREMLRKESKESIVFSSRELKWKKESAHSKPLVKPSDLRFRKNG
eukprot:CAMPEP_0184686080 /NCGR_PEP_ID=MMETSP0312-20130426/21253_1 /TAXON_ID=31354 /ORGANISM="Compsopogon coeruleus, Strain SAG 36.94" /LENGTH=58 /DNA_ID=CAMNT_0027140825 /DNA_START=404 /DNA_END=580 /DNA_ORIENTATION=-